MKIVGIDLGFWRFSPFSVEKSSLLRGSHLFYSILFWKPGNICLQGTFCLVGFFTSSSASRPSRPRLMSDNFTILPANAHRQSGEFMTSVSAGHFILTPTNPVESGNRTYDLLTRGRALYPLSYCKE